MITKLPFLPDAHHYAIAHVATRAAQLDHMIEAAIQALLFDKPETAKYLLYNLGDSRQIGLLKSLLLDRLELDLTQATALIAAITKARKERHEVIHWLWGKADDPEMARNVTLRPFREEQIKTRSAQDIQDIAEAMLKASTELGVLATRVREEILASLRQRFGPQFLQPHSAAPSGADHQDTPAPPDPQLPPFPK
jgi:hypothetical protein